MVGASLVVFAGRDLAPALLLERAGVARGEVWRLWTGHLVHFGAAHLAWNLAIVALAGAWAERLAPVRTRLLYALAPAATSGLLLAVERDLMAYGGLSGLAVGIVALLGTQLARTERTRWFGQVLLALVVVKISVEWLRGDGLFVVFADEGVRAVPLAHAIGLGCGLVGGLVPGQRAPS